MANSEENKQKSPTIEELAIKLKVINLEFKQNLANLQEKLEEFYSSPQFGGIESAKQEVESRATSLEKEVQKLREELKTIKESLGLTTKENKSVNS